MAEHSKISWTTHTINFATGCTKVSPGCEHCYMFREYARLGRQGVRGYDRSPDVVQLFPERLLQLTPAKRPAMWFVNSMSDTFHRDVPDGLILDAFRRFAAMPEHVFQVLTKRPGRVPRFARLVERELGRWPPNVWIGTSVENQTYAGRIDRLFDVPARVRFVSVEPMLGPVDLSKWLFPIAHVDEIGRVDYAPQIQWVIAGGESGPDARPMHPEWVVRLRAQCREADVPMFLKQWGEHVPTSELGGDVFLDDGRMPDSARSLPYEIVRLGASAMARVGRRRDPETLGGVEIKEWPPEAAHIIATRP